MLLSPDDAKLNFDKEMLRLQQVIKTGSPDKRGMARIRFALARFNSFNGCWALTKYWDGDANQCYYRPFYWLWDGNIHELGYLKEMTGSITTERWLESELRKGISELKTTEVKAYA